VAAAASVEALELNLVAPVRLAVGSRLWMGVAGPPEAWLAAIELGLMPQWRLPIEWLGKSLLVAATLRVAQCGVCWQESSTNAVF
jgi:hypothetical protein